MTITLKQLQEEQSEWVANNFPNRLNFMPLLGMIEELGELAHVELKGQQKIRYTADEITAKKRDAIGDIMVYTADFCTANYINIDSTTEQFPHVTLDRQPPNFTPEQAIFQAHRALSRVCESFYDGEIHASTSYHIGKFIHHLRHYCDVSNFDFFEAIDYTWSKVKQRNWIKNPLTANQKVEGSI